MVTPKPFRSWRHFQFNTCVVLHPPSHKKCLDHWSPCTVSVSGLGLPGVTPVSSWRARPRNGNWWIHVLLWSVVAAVASNFWQSSPQFLGPF
jgi:hypothetical protein